MKRVQLITLVLGILGLANTVFAALLTYDLRINPVQNDPDVNVLNDHYACINDEGDLISMTLYARLTGVTDTANSGVRCAAVSVASGSYETQSRILGDIGNVTLVSPFGSGPGATTGASADLDGDTDLDRGSNQMIHPMPTTWMWATNGSIIYNESDSEVALFNFDFKVTYIPGFSATELNVYPYATSSALAGGAQHQFKINGIFYAQGNKIGVPGSTPAWTPEILESVGIHTQGCVVEFIPEPSTLILLTTGFLALLTIGGIRSLNRRAPSS